MPLVSLPNTFVDDVDQVASGDEVMENFNAILAVLNGNLDVDNFGPSIGSPVLFSGGKSIVSTEESRSSTSYGVLSTPDQVSDVVVPQNGLLVVVYQASFKSSVSTAGYGALFLDSNQVKQPAAESDAIQEAQTPGTVYVPLASSAEGLRAGTGTDYLGDATTGHIVSADRGKGGGFTVLSAAAATYDVSVRFKATSGSVSAKNRKLWAFSVAL